MHWIRDWSWRLAILLLPWQIRWFQEGLTVGGLSWEQGRLAFYVSWIPVVVTIFVACAHFKERLDQKLSVSDWSVVAGMLLLALPAFVSIHPPASWQWLTQVILLAFFGWSMLELRISGREFLSWTVLAIVPHAALGIWQYVAQEVAGTKWLGMASQLPADPGVSVVEVGGRRVLRAYGGLPHPNILGGWLVYGLVALMLLASQASERRFRVRCAGAAALFSVALILTFSRSAWLAAVVALLATTAMAWSKAWTLEEKLRLPLIPIVAIVAALTSVFVLRDVISVRAVPETRLEEKSVNERTTSLAAGWRLVGEEWWLGQGQNTSILALDRAGSGIIPPHFVLLLILLETGIIGSIGAALLLARWIARGGFVSLFVLAAALPLLLLDHYLWSLWSGQSLAALFAVLPFLRLSDAGIDEVRKII